MVPARILRFALSFAVLVGAVTVAPTQQASASTRGSLTIVGPNAAPPGYDHILCYVADFTAQFTPVSVKLLDQIYPQGFNATLNQDSTVCTPAMKQLLYRKPLKVKPNGHYVCYPLTNSLPYIDQTRSYMNQLESNTAVFLEPYFLCVPTHKYPVSAQAERVRGAREQPDVSAAKNHLMGYDINNYGAAFANPLPGTTVRLYDQFFPYPSGGFLATLGNPFMLLTPTKKTYKLGKKVNDNGHWVIYYFAQPTATNETHRYVNQLEKNSVDVFYPNYLFVPTYKDPSSEPAPQGRLYHGGHSPIPPQHPQ